MKKFLMLLPLLLVGCVHWVISTDRARVVSVATGTTGKVDYSCSQLDFPDHNYYDIIFRCEFHNLTDQRQPGPAIHIALYSEKTNELVMAGPTIYALPTNPGQGNLQYTHLIRNDFYASCGNDLERCAVLVEKDAR